MTPIRSWSSWTQIISAAVIIGVLGAPYALSVVLTDLRANGDVVSTANPLPVTGTVTATPGVVGNGTAATAQRVTVASDSTGTIIATQGTASNLKTEPAGNVASGSADSGNPVKIGGVYKQTVPDLTNGWRNDLLVGFRGSLHTELWATDSISPIVANTDNADGVAVSSAANRLGVVSRPTLFNGTTWDRAFTCTSQTSATVTAAATTQLVALSGSTNTRVCSYQVGIATTGTFKFVSGTGSNCGTGTADITPATNLTAGNVVAVSAGNNAIFRAGASNALCLTAVTGNVQVFVSYAQF